MMEFMMGILISICYAYVAHELVRFCNRKWRELDMSPNLSAIIALIFGLVGIVVLAVYGVIKVLVKRMLKH